METSSKAQLEDLVRNSLRMRPDRLIVGEIRGNEAEDLFTAMNIGNRGILATLHANSDRDAVRRLENAPMNVPRSMLPLLDIMVVQHRMFDRKKGRLVRRVMQVSEVSRLEDEIALNEIYTWNAEASVLEPTKLASESKEKLAKATGKSIREVSEEVLRRKRLVEYLVEKNITEQERVNQFMRTYYGELLRADKEKPPS
jgi:flagellar protein FlaI